MSTIASCVVVLLGLLLYVVKVMREPVSKFTDLDECPFCYGTDLCEDVEDKRINLRYKSFADFFYNVLSVKNLFFAEYDGEGVVLKKLGYWDELEAVKRRTRPQFTQTTNVCDGAVASFRSCSVEACAAMVARVSPKFGVEQIWTLLQTNVEPLILTVFPSDNWPVPKLRGACGLLIMEDYCGLPLNHFQASPWRARARLAAQLLRAAIDFTHKHEDFRLYLTDVSPDNIAVDDNFTLYFVDLENVILKRNEDNATIHYSEHFADEGFVYSEDQVCQSSISDHNVYAVCRLLLSERAPWPMMPNGLLHSPPPDVMATNKELFSLVEECVDSEEKLDRFDIARELIRLLQGVVE